MCLRFKIAFLGFKNIGNIRLRIQIDQRKPSALDLNLQFMTFFKGVKNILKFNVYCSFLIRDKGFRL